MEIVRFASSNGESPKHGVSCPSQARCRRGTNRGADAAGIELLKIDVHEETRTVMVQGEVDLTGGAALVEAVAGLRHRHPDQPVAIDTSEVGFIDVAGRRALRRALCRPDGTSDPMVVHILGATVARFEIVLGLATRAR